MVAEPWRRVERKSRAPSGVSWQFVSTGRATSGLGVTNVQNRGAGRPRAAQAQRAFRLAVCAVSPACRREPARAFCFTASASARAGAGSARQVGAEGLAVARREGGGVEGVGLGAGLLDDVAGAE